MLKTAADYAIWRDELSAVLQVKVLWDLAFRQPTAPDQLQGETTTQFALQKAEYTQWMMQAASLIQLSLRRHFRLMVKQHENDLKRMMEVLNEQFKPKANAGKLDMLM